jgi:hypothetical protein
MYDSQVLSDIAFEFESGKYIYAHSFVLYRFKYFKALIDRELKHVPQTSVKVECDEKVFRNLVKCIYKEPKDTGLSFNESIEVYLLATKYVIPTWTIGIPIPSDLFQIFKWVDADLMNRLVYLEQILGDILKSKDGDEYSCVFDSVKHNHAMFSYIAFVYPWAKEAISELSSFMFQILSGYGMEPTFSYSYQNFYLLNGEEDFKVCVDLSSKTSLTFTHISSLSVNIHYLDVNTDHQLNMLHVSNNNLYVNGDLIQNLCAKSPSNLIHITLYKKEEGIFINVHDSESKTETITHYVSKGKEPFLTVTVFKQDPYPIYTNRRSAPCFKFHHCGETPKASYRKLKRKESLIRDGSDSDDGLQRKETKINE